MQDGRVQNAERLKCKNAEMQKRKNAAGEAVSCEL
jgi:hypothetical protein